MDREQMLGYGIYSYLGKYHLALGIELRAVFAKQGYHPGEISSSIVGLNQLGIIRCDHIGSRNLYCDNISKDYNYFPQKDGSGVVYSDDEKTVEYNFAEVEKARKEELKEFCQSDECCEFDTYAWEYYLEQ